MVLLACGDDVTKVVQSEEATVPVYSSSKDIPKCDSSIIGKMVYIEDSLATFYCSEKGWLSTNGKDGEDGEQGESCIVKEIENGYSVWCAGDSVGVLLNGADGKNGADGEKAHRREKGKRRQKSLARLIFLSMAQAATIRAAPPMMSSISPAARKSWTAVILSPPSGLLPQQQKRMMIPCCRS